MPVSLLPVSESGDILYALTEIMIKSPQDNVIKTDNELAFDRVQFFKPVFRKLCFPVFNGFSIKHRKR